jgi:hypothetical protein
MLEIHTGTNAAWGKHSDQSCNKPLEEDLQ